MTLNWKRVGIIAGALLVGVVALKFMPLWASLVAIACTAAGFGAGVVWIKAQSDE